MKSGTTPLYCEFGSCRGPKTLKYLRATPSRPYTAWNMAVYCSAASLETPYGEMGFGTKDSCLGGHRGRTVHGGGGRGDHAPDAGVTRGKKHVECAGDVHCGRRERVLHGAGHGWQGGKVNHVVDAHHCVVNTFVAPEITLHKLDIC